MMAPQNAMAMPRPMMALSRSLNSHTASSSVTTGLRVISKAALPAGRYCSPDRNRLA